MKKIWLLIGVIAFSLVLFTFFRNKGDEQPERMPTQKFLVGGNELQVEIADNEDKRAQGLSDRFALCENCGMLFVYERPDFYSFWMRRMYFDIDILWIYGNKIVDITYGAKKPGVTEFDSPKQIYTSKVATDRVLEVESGWVEKNQVKIGDEVE